MRYLLQSLRMRNRNWSRNLSIILALGTWWCESIRALIRYNVRSRHTHTRIYFRWCDLARSRCSIRYDKMRSDEIVQIEFPIGSRSDPIITRPQLVTLKPCVRADTFIYYVKIRLSKTDMLCYDGAWYDGDSFHDQDGRLLTIQATIFWQSKTF